MRDEQCRQVSEGGAGDNADDHLLEQINQGCCQREFAVRHGQCQHRKGGDRPVASLRADSLTTVCATRSRILTCWKIGTRVAGSVEASVVPNSAAAIDGTPRT